MRFFKKKVSNIRSILYQNRSKGIKRVHPANHFAGCAQLITNFLLCGLRNFI